MTMIAPSSVCPCTVRLLLRFATHSNVIVVGLASNVRRSTYLRKSNQDLPEEPEASVKDLGVELATTNVNTRNAHEEMISYGQVLDISSIIFWQPICSILITSEYWSRGCSMNHASPQGVTLVLGHLCKPSAFTCGALTIWLQGTAHSLIGNEWCAQACTQVHPRKLWAVLSCCS